MELLAVAQCPPAGEPPLGEDADLAGCAPQPTRCEVGLDRVLVVVYDQH